jgi:hypothetical protein
MTSKPITARAIVTRGSHREGKWAIEDVTLRDFGPNELLIQMVASGICHTDMHFGDAAESIGGYPRVLGHEGSVLGDMLPIQRLMSLVRLRIRQSNRFRSDGCPAR